MALKRNREAGEPLLDKPRILSAEPGALSQWLFYGALLLLGTLGRQGSPAILQVLRGPLTMGTWLGKGQGQRLPSLAAIDPPQAVQAGQLAADEGGWPRAH